MIRNTIALQQNKHQLTNQFVSELAHEVRNPLASINLSVAMLTGAIKDDELTIYLDIITRCSAKINSLVCELANYQAADNVQPEKYSMTHLLDEVLEMCEDRILLKHVSVKTAYIKRDIKMAVDRPKMKIALTNIIINAVDAMASKNGVLTITTRVIGGRFTILIKDNGCGISKGDLKKIFNPHFTKRASGLGMGLALTSNILRSNHVNVRVESEEKKGTGFILSFNRPRS